MIFRYNSQRNAPPLSLESRSCLFNELVSFVQVFSMDSSRKEK